MFYLGLLLAFVFGFGLHYYINISERRIFLDENQRLRESGQQSLDAMKGTFTELAQQVMQTNSEEFLKLAGTKFEALSQSSQSDLASKKDYIVGALNESAKTINELKIQNAEISQNLTTYSDEAHRLRSTTDNLRELLSSSQKRGQWGERVVEDIIRKIGLIKDTSYYTQHMMKSGEKPDFTFPLTGGMSVNLDVKFPLDNYEAYLNAVSDHEREDKKKAFIKDVRGHIKTLAGKGYIAPGEGTVDYMLAFIPNEGMYAFIHDADPKMMDYAMDASIVMCSPITLYAVLSLIRQSVRSFAMEQKAGQILALIRDFLASYEKYGDAVDKMGRSLDTLNNDFKNVTTTRSKALERKIEKITDIDTVQIEAGEEITT